ncbi:MAG: transglutaminase-like domain-containing protein [bacterium]
MRKISILLIIVSVFLFSIPNSIYADQMTFPTDVSEALDSAGTNRGELEKVIAHYQSDPDTLKLLAAYFLIGNMDGHSFVTYKLVDTIGNLINFNVLDYQNYPELEDSFKILEQEHGVLDFERDENISDLKTIKAAFLVNQIDYAFRAWYEKPWAKKLSFDNFCEYVLPYRGSNEPLEEWRQALWDKYRGIESELSDPENPIEAAIVINDDILTWFTFDPRYYYHPTDQSLSEMQSSGLGRCEDMTNVTIYAMRANGLAVTSDYTPYWANTGNNHAWNSIMNVEGEVTPFMGAESNPGKYQLANKLAKAYRKTYGKQKNNLVFQEHKQEKVPGWLAGKNYKDVTSDYVDVSNVDIKFERKIPDSVDIAYLCVFNSGEWSAIHWGRVENNTAEFTDMGTGIVYLPALYINKEITPFGPPFILNKNHSIDYLLINEDLSISVELKSTTEKKLVASTDGITKTFLNPGKTYEFYYWDDGWQLSREAVAGEEPLKFDNIPAGCLYWLVEKDSDKEERIFTIEDGLQIWW